MRSRPKRGAEPDDAVDPEQVEGAVDDGLLIARSAASVEVANTIIVRALREQRPFVRAEAAGDVRDAIGHLIREQRDLAARMIEARSRALKSRGRSRHQFDYRAGDSSALASREAIYSTIADRLDALIGDDEYVDDIITAARDRAWNDIGAAILKKAGAGMVPDSEYEAERDERLRTFLREDLAALAADASSPGRRRR